MRKVIGRIVALLIAVECLYLLAANLFLALGGVAYLFKDTSSVNARFKSAWTLVPGRVEIRGLRIVFQDHNLQWSLDLERVHVTIRLTELTRRTFHATRVRADGVAFHMRHRIDPESVHEPWVGALPPIPEFNGPAVFEARAPEAPISDAEYKLWTVHLEDVDVGVSDVWVQAFHYAGKGRARGQFLLRPARWLWVGPASLELAPGTLTVSAYEVAHDLRGKIACTVQPFDVRIPSGMRVFRYISAQIALESQDFSPAFMSLFGAQSLRGLTAEHGTLALDVRLQHGVITSGSSVALTERDVSVYTRDPELNAQQVQLSARALPDGTSRVTLAIDEGRLNRNLASGPAPEILSAELALDADNLDTTRSFQFRELRLEHASVELADARWFDDLLRAARLEVSGKMTLRATGRYLDSRNSTAELELELGDDALLARRGAAARLRVPGAKLVARMTTTPGRREANWSLQAPRVFLNAPRASLRSALRARGSLRQTPSEDSLRLVATGVLDAPRASFDRSVTVRSKRVPFAVDVTRNERGALDGVVRAEFAELVGSLGKVTVRAQPTLRAELVELDLARSRGLLRATVVTPSLTAESGPGDARCPWLSAGASRVALTAELDARSGPALVVQGEAANSQLSWGDFVARGDLVASTRLERGTLAGHGNAVGSVALRGAHITSGTGEGVGWEARAPVLTLGYSANFAQDRLSMDIDMAATHARGRIGSSSLGADLDARIALAGVDLAAHTARGAAELRIFNASLAAGKERVENWWGNVRLDALNGGARDNLDFAAGYSARLRDASPALAVLASHGSLPAWVEPLFPLRDVQIAGSVTRRCRLTDFRLERMSGGPLVSRGRLESTPQGFQGALLLRLRALQLIAAGLEFDSEHVGVSPLVGDGWLARENARLDRAAQRCEPPPEDTLSACSAEP
ncbi:MAG TPA: hypothetical protein VGI10_31135 [Polyangiaceae bacterium]